MREKKLDLLAKTFCCLQHQAALLFEPTMPSQVEVEVIQKEAAGALLVGLELFYPSQNSQARLLAETLKMTEMTEKRGAGKAPKTAYKLLCRDLLERLSNGDVAFQLVESFVSVFNEESSSCVSQDMLHRLIETLIKQLTSGADLLAEDAKVLQNSVLAIQKQCFYWAAQSAAKPRSAVLCLSTTHSDISRARLKIKSHSQISNGMHLLIHYCRVILSSSFTCLLDFGEDTEHQLTYLDVVRIYKSPLGELLRNLLNGLLPFAQDTNLASGLMSYLSRLFRAIGTLSLPVVSPCTSGRDWPVLWFEELGKTTAALSGAMAATLIHKNSIKKHTSIDPKIMGLMSDLFVRGLKLTWLFELMQQRTLPAMVFVASVHANILDPSSQIPCPCINSSGKKFTVSIVSGRGAGDRFCRWLRQVYGNCDPSYLMVLQQARRENNQQVVWDIEKIAAVLLIKHNKYETEVCMYAARTSTLSFLPRLPPRRFLYMWSGVARLTAWLCHQTTTKRSDEKRLLLNGGLSQLLFLLSFRSPGEHSFDTLSPCRDHVCGLSMGETQSILSEPRIRLRCAILHVRVSMKWRLRSKGNRTRQSKIYCSHSTSKVMRFLRSCLETNGAIGHKLRFLKHCILCTVVESYRCAGLQQSGMDALRRLINLSSVSHFLVFALYPLPVLKSAHLLGQPTLNDLFEFIDYFSKKSLLESSNKHHESICTLMQKTVFIVCSAEFSMPHAKLLLLLLASTGQDRVTGYLGDCLRTQSAKDTISMYRTLLIYSAGQCSQLHLKSTQIKNQGERFFRKIFNAVWALLRNLGISTPHSINVNLTLGCKSVSYMYEVYREVAWRNIINLGSKSVARKKKTYFQSSESVAPCSNQRRCQEIISSPLRLINMKESVCVWPGTNMSTPKGADFSFTFWLFVSENATGYRKIVLMRGVESFLWPIIFMGDNNMRLEIVFSAGTNDVEHLHSKEVIPLHSWTHVGLVVEGNKVKVYFNGKLDHQHLCKFSLSDISLLPMFIGRPSDGRLNGSINYTNCGLDGYVAHLRYYTRALSPIHLRIVCDQGSPGTFQAGDGWCYQLVSILLINASADSRCIPLRAFDWFEIFRELIEKGTSRIKQASIRILQHLLPDIEPIYARDLTLSTRRLPADKLLLNYLSACIGLIAWQDKSDEEPSPNAFQFKQEGVVDSSLVFSELIILFRHLLTIERWGPCLFLLLKALLDTSHRVCHQSVAISLLGGYSFSIDAGTLALLSETSDQVEVIVFDYLTCRALVISCAYDTSIKSPSRHFQPFHVSADKLSIQSKKTSGWTAKLLQKILILPKVPFLPLLLNFFDMRLFSMSVATLNNMRSARDFAASIDGVRVLSQCIKALHALSLGPGLLQIVAEWPRLINVLMRMSLEVCVIGNQFVVPDGVELCTVFLRHRLRYVSKRNAHLHLRKGIGHCSGLHDKLRQIDDSSYALVHVAAMDRIKGRIISNLNHQQERYQNHDMKAIECSFQFLNTSPRTHSTNFMNQAKSLLPHHSLHSSVPIAATKFESHMYVENYFSEESSPSSVHFQKFDGSLLSKHTTFVNQTLHLGWTETLNMSRHVEKIFSMLQARALLRRILMWSYCLPHWTSRPHITVDVTHISQLMLLRLSHLFFEQLLSMSQQSSSFCDSALKQLLVQGLKNTTLMQGKTGYPCSFCLLFSRSLAAFKFVTFGERLCSLSTHRVEFTSSLMEIAIKRSMSVCTAKNFSILIGLLRSKCPPLKEKIMRLAAMMVSRWSNAITHSLPVATSTEYLIDVLVTGNMQLQLRSDLHERISIERRQRRLCFSGYVLAGIELLVEFSTLEKTLLRILNPNSSCAQQKVILQRPLVEFTSKNSIYLNWNQANSASIYTLEMARSICGVPEACLRFRVVYQGMHTSALIRGLSASKTYFFRVTLKSDSQSPLCSSFSQTFALETNTGPAFTFDHVNKGSAISLSTDGLHAVFGANETWATILGSAAFISDCNSWEFEYINSTSLFLFVGVALAQADLTTFLGGDEFSWGYIGDRALYHRRMKTRPYGERFGHGDTIGVMLNMDHGAVSFSKNGIDLGVAFNGLSGEIFPAVAFYNKGQQVALVENAFKCPSAGDKLVDSPSLFDIDQVSETFELMSFMTRLTPTPMSASTLDRLRRQCESWLDGGSFRIKTCFGFATTIDKRVDPSLPVSYGQHVRTPRGNAFVIGSAFGLVWFDSGQNVGAHFYPSAAVHREVLHGYFQTTTSTSCANSRPYIQQRISDVSHIDGHLDPHCLLDKKLHALVAKEIDFLSQSSKETAWNLDPSALMARLSRSTTRHDPRSFTVMAHYVALILLLNDDILCGISFLVNADMHQVLLHSSSFREAQTRCHLRMNTDCCRTSLFKLRRSILRDTKHTIFQNFMQHTRTIAKKAEDDYDYPEDLTHVTLNRFKATVALNEEQCKDQLKTSLFGQLFRSLHFLRPSLLRMGYTHPMDDGQERTFKVKFDGEGVDDYGGPYREIFAQIPNELQNVCSTCTESSRCFLPLLLPAAANTTIPGGVAKFIINPRATSEFDKRLFKFVGQLMGIAIRCKVALPLDLPSCVWKFVASEQLVPEDLLEIDDGAFAMLRELDQLHKCTDKDMPQPQHVDITDIRWTAYVSGNSKIQLIETTSNALAAGEIPAFISALCQCRLHENKQALLAMVAGLATIIPKAVLPLLSWREIEKQICGVPGVDINILFSNTEYDDGLSPCDSHIKTFWEILHSFDDVEKSAFLRFVWARSRLSPSSTTLCQKFKIQAAVGDGPTQSPDKFLPKAHTCFFSINLPKYTSKKIMLKRLRYAIWNCTEMDADFRLSDNELTAGWFD